MSESNQKRIESPEKTVQKSEKQARIQHYQEDQKGRIDMIQQIKTQMTEEQNQYYANIIQGLGKIDISLADRNIKNINYKVLQGLVKGDINLEQYDKSKQRIVNDSEHGKQVRNAEKEKEILLLKLKGIDNELGSLQKQKHDNPLSGYGQPSLKIYVDEQNLHKQQSVNQKEQEDRFVVKKKLQDRLDREMEKVKIQEELVKEIKLEKFNQKHEKITLHIAEIKKKHDNRLREMIELEDQYFTQLDLKLNKLREDRSLIKYKKQNINILTNIKKKEQVSILRNDNSIDMKNEPLMRIKSTDAQSISTQNLSEYQIIQISQIPQSVLPRELQLNKSDNDITKNTLIEQPLYQRLNDDYHLKQQEESRIEKIKLEKIIEHKKQYENIDYTKHQLVYKEKQQILKEKYQNKRLEKLKKLGIFKKTRNQHKSADSKLWLLGEQEKIQAMQDQQQKLEDKLEKIRKLKLYIESIKKNTSQIHISDSKQMVTLLRKDKLANPKKYIKKLKKKNSKTVVLSDNEIYKTNFKDIDPSQQIKNGNLYLIELPLLIEKAKQEELQKSRLTQVKSSKSAKGFQLSTIVVDQNSHMLTVKKIYNLEQRSIDKNKWQKVLDQKQTLPIIPEQEKNKRVVELNSHKTTKAQKINDLSTQLDEMALKKEKVADAHWTKKPLRALNETNIVDDMIIDSIKAKLAVLDLQQDQYRSSSRQPI